MWWQFVFCRSIFMYKEKEKSLSMSYWLMADWGPAVFRVSESFWFACFSCAYMNFLCVLWFFPTAKHMQLRLTGYSILLTEVNVSVNGGLSFCVRPVIEWQPAQCVPRLTKVSSDWLHLPHDPKQINGIGDKYKLVCFVLVVICYWF